MPPASMPYSCQRSICLLCFLACSLSAYAQKKFTDDLSLTFNYHSGYIVPEYSNFTYLVNDKVRAASLSFSKKTTGKNDWEVLYNFPEYGVSLFYTTLGNKEVHGSEIALFPYFNLDIISRRRFSLYNQTGIGFGYATRRFDLEENYLNVAVGSHINIHFNFKLGANYQVHKKMCLHSGFSFDHLSNGNLSEPNLGINSLTFYSGIGYTVGHQNEKNRYELKPHRQGYHYEFVYSVGGKHPRALDSKFYFTSSATFEFKWEPLRAIHFGVGADLFYDTSTEVEMLAANSTEFKEGDSFRSGIHLSQEFVYSKLSLIIQEGVYLLLTDKVDGNVMYNRGIVRYRVSENFFCHISMKSHLHILDYPEFGFGVRW